MSASPDARTANLLGAVALAVGDTVQRAVVEATGRGGAAAAALDLLRQEPGCSVEQLRHGLGLSHPGAVRLVQGLEREGLVARRPAGDRRAVAISLTAKGERGVTALLRARSDALNRALGAVPAVERRLLMRLLERLLHGLAADVIEADGLEICRLCDVSVCPPRRCPVGVCQ